MKFYTLCPKAETLEKDEIIVSDFQLKKIEYTEEETTKFTKEASNYLIQYDYYYDDGDDFVDSSNRMLETEPSQFVIDENRCLVGFYVFRESKTIRINGILMIDGTTIGCVEDSDSFPEASDTLIHMADISISYSLIKK